MQCEEGKGNPGVSQGKHFHQESVQLCCVLRSSHHSFEKKDEFILQQSQRLVMVVTRERRVIILRESNWAGSVPDLAEGWVGRDVAVSYKYAHGWTPGKAKNKLIWKTQLEEQLLYWLFMDKSIWKVEAWFYLLQQVRCWKTLHYW